MTTPNVVAIDGAAGSGKSTLAEGLARRLGLPYVNTGLMYRALAAAAIRECVSPGDAAGLQDLMSTLTFEVEPGDPPTLEVGGYTLDDLTSLEVETTVSAVARHPAIRDEMRRAQRAIGLERGAVMEGRDIASVVFTDAPVKLYLVADPRARAARRAEERSGNDRKVTEQLHARDEADAVTNPFEPAEGADVIDTGVLPITSTLEEALRLIGLRAPWLLEGVDR
jgi:cytidylate kinase